MKNRKAFLSTMIFVVLLSSILVGCGGVPKVEWELKVTGEVQTPLTLDYGMLVAMPQVDLTDILMQKSLGEDEVVSWSGVPLDEILSKAGAGNYSSITATAADGYAIEISADEVEGAIIALKKGGDWITKAEPDKGPIRLVCPETPANRWVFQIKEIVLNP